MADLLLPADQASGLRRLFEKRATRVIAVAFAQHGSARSIERVRVIMQLVDDLLAADRTGVLLDEHSGPGSVAHAYGVVSGKDFKQALHGDYLLDEVMFTPRPGLRLIPAVRAAGMEFTLADEAALAGNLALLRSASDWIMIDCAPRARRVLSPMAAAADQLLVVVAASGDDLTRAYGLIKRAALEKATLPIAVIMAHATDAKHAKTTYDKLRRVAFDHLGIRLHYQGAVLTPGASRLNTVQAPAFRTSGKADMSQPDSLMGRMGMADSMV